MNNDLISRLELRKKLQARYDNGEEDFDKGYNIGIASAIELLDNAPTVEYTFEEAFQKTVCEQKLYCPKIPQGEWIEFADFVARNVVSEDFSEDVDFYAEVLCRKLVKLGLVKLDGDTYKYCGANMKGGAE